MNNDFDLLELTFISMVPLIALVLLLTLACGCQLERNSVQKVVCLNSTETYKAYEACKSGNWETFIYQLVLDNQ